jgi:hypothetical protein
MRIKEYSKRECIKYQWLVGHRVVITDIMYCGQIGTIVRIATYKSSYPVHICLDNGCPDAYYGFYAFNLI